MEQTELARFVEIEEPRLVTANGTADGSPVYTTNTIERLSIELQTARDEIGRLRVAGAALLDAMTAEGHYSDPAGCDERTETAMGRLSRLVR